MIDPYIAKRIRKAAEERNLYGGLQDDALQVLERMEELEWVLGVMRGVIPVPPQVEP